MTSRLTALGPAIHAFGSMDEAFDALAENFGEVPEDTDFPFHRHADSGRDLAASRPVDPQAPPAFSSRPAALADTSTRPDAERRAA